MVRIQRDEQCKVSAQHRESAKSMVVITERLKRRQQKEHRKRNQTHLLGKPVLPGISLPYATNFTSKTQWALPRNGANNARRSLKIKWVWHSKGPGLWPSSPLLNIPCIWRRKGRVLPHIMEQVAEMALRSLILMFLRFYLALHFTIMKKQSCSFKKRYVPGDN